MVRGCFAALELRWLALIYGTIFSFKKGILYLLWLSLFNGLNHLSGTNVENKRSGKRNKTFFTAQHQSGLTFSGTNGVYLNSPEMFQNPADNYTVNLNGKLITPSASRKCTVHCSAGPLQDATLLDRKYSTLQTQPQQEKTKTCYSTG